MVMQAAWSLSPLWAPGLLLILIEELGVARLRARCSPERARQWRWRAVAFDLGIAAVCLIDSSPLMGKSMEHLTIHMLLHVVEMFYLPILLLLGAPSLVAAFALTPDTRRAVLSWWYRGRARRVGRVVSGVLEAPIVGIVAFNATMLFWHLPRVFEWAALRPWVHTWLMLPSFVVVGYLFWRLILPSGPWRPRATLKFQVLAVVVTAATMLILAISMAIMTKTAWYSPYVAALGPEAAFSDQQLAAGVLWICGDFWVAPALIIIGRRVIESEGSLSSAFERRFGRRAQ